MKYYFAYYIIVRICVPSEAGNVQPELTVVQHVQHSLFDRAIPKLYLIEIDKPRPFRSRISFPECTSILAYNKQP